MTVELLLWCVAGLLALAVAAVALAGKAQATAFVYGGALAATLIALAFGTQFLLADLQLARAAL